MRRPSACFRTAVLALSILAVAAGYASAQLGGAVCLYSDPSGTDCNILDTAPGLVEVYVVHQYANDVSAVEFSVPPPACSQLIYITFNSPYLFLGDPIGGVQIAYGQCLSAPVNVGTITFFGQGLTPADCAYEVMPYPGQSTVVGYDCDSNPMVANGGTAYINPSVMTCSCSQVFEEPYLSVTPAQLAFGSDLDSLFLDVENYGTGDLNWTATESASWLTVTPMGGVNDATLSVAVDRTGLSPDTYSTDINFSSDGGFRQVFVSMVVPDPNPVLVVTPTALAFGQNLTTRTFTIENAGLQPLNWYITENISWCNVSAVAGTDDATVTVTVDRTGLGGGSHSGIITVTSNGGSALVSVSVDVAGVPVLSVSPTTLDFGGLAETLTFDIENVGAPTLNWGVYESIPWLDVPINTGSGDRTITVNVDRTGLLNGVYGDSLEVRSNGGDEWIAVSMTVGPHLEVSPTALNYGSSGNLLTLSIINSGSGQLDWSISESIPWLSVSQTSGSDEADVGVTVSRAGLPEGSYSGSIDVTSNGGIATVPVTMSVVSGSGVAGTICLYGDVDGDVCTLTDDGPGVMTVYVIHQGSQGATGVNFLAPKPTCLSGAWLGDSSPFLTVGDSQNDGIGVVFGQCLSSPTYLMSIQYSVSGATASDCPYPVLPFPGDTYVEVADCNNELRYGAGGLTYINSTLPCSCAEVVSPPVMEVEPASVIFYAADSSDTFEVSNLGDQALEWQVQTGYPSWLGLSQTEGTNDATVTMTVDRTGLANGTYGGFVDIWSNGGTDRVGVNLIVSSEEPVLFVSPDQLDFGEAQTNLAITIQNQGINDLNWTLTETLPWLSLSQTTGTNNASVTVTVDRSGLSPGTYSGTIDVTSNGGNASVDVTVAYMANPVLAVTPDSLDFDSTQAVLELEVANVAGGNLTWTTSDNRSWITVSPSNGTGDATLQVEVFRQSLGSAGTFSGEVYVNSNGGGAVVPVTATVLANPLLSITPTELTFPNGTDQAILLVRNAGTGDLDWTLSESADWMQLNRTSGTNNADVVVVVDRSGLAQGTYQDSIYATSNAGNQTIPVTMHVVPVLQVTPLVVEILGEDTEGVFDIANAGSGELDWSINESVPWLSVTPTAGTNDAAVTVTVDRTGLPNGLHTGTVYISSNGGNEQVTVSTIVGPSLVVEPASLQFDELVTVRSMSISNEGSGTLEWTASTNQPWVSVLPDSGSGDATANVSIDTGMLSTGTYNAVVTVTSNGGMVDVGVQANLSADYGNPQLYFYFDAAFSQNYIDCPQVPDQQLQTAYVVATGFGTYINALEFKVDYPGAMLWLGEQVSSPLYFGNTHDGIAIAWDTPQDFQNPTVVVQVNFIWQCVGCAEYWPPISFSPNPQSGQLRAVEWQTQRVIPVQGISSYVCNPPVETRPMTWSQLKALMQGEEQLKAGGKQGE